MNIWPEATDAVYPSEYRETDVSHDAISAMFLSGAEREYEEFEAEMAAAAKACP